MEGLEEEGAETEARTDDRGDASAGEPDAAGAGAVCGGRRVDGEAGEGRGECVEDGEAVQQCEYEDVAPLLGFVDEL